MSIDLLFAALVTIVLPVRAWRRHRRNAPPTPPTRYLTETMLLTLLLGVLLWRHNVPLEAIGLQSHLTARFCLDLAIALGAVVGPDIWLMSRLTRRIREAAEGLGRDRVFADTLANRRAPLRFAAVAVVGAVWEELCFRGVVFLLVPRTAVGLLTGIAASSLLFAAQHLRNGRQGFAYASAFGVIFAVLYVTTGDLAAVIIAHATGNILAVFQWAPAIERARQEALLRAPMSLGQK